MSTIKRAIFIAAGTGTRLRPVTNEMPKPLIPVNGKRIIDGLLDAGFAAVSAGSPAFQVVGALAFIVAALALTVLVFRKKEIEF